eukprot:3089532-Pleurochrysis_carterae.AAC.1
MELNGQSDAVGNFDAHHVRVALRYAVGRKEAAIAACRACRATVNKCSSRAADGARRSRRVGHRSSRYGNDWHRACGLEKKEEDQERADRVAVVIARMLCMMVMPSVGCALEMALRTA